MFKLLYKNNKFLYLNAYLIIKLDIKMKLTITFLGTGTSQGIPVINSSHPVCLSEDKKDKRLRSSILVEWEGYTYLIDCGPDFRYQMLRAGVKKLDGILFTHEHSDHVAGLDDIRSFVFKQGAMPIYAPKRVLDDLISRFSYIFNDKNKYPGAPSVISTILDEEPFDLKGMTVNPIISEHGKIPVYGFRFGDFAYLTDVKTIPEKEINKLFGLKVLVINALRKEAHHSHLTLDESIEIIKELKPKRAYITHISNRLGFHAEVEKTLPKNVFLAYDELVLEI